MFEEFDFKSTLLLTLFAFVGGLTRELNDVINNKLRIKSFMIGLITASTTGLIVSQILIEYKIGFHLSCFLTGISGFMGPYVLFSTARIMKRKLEKLEARMHKEVKREQEDEFI